MHPALLLLSLTLLLPLAAASPPHHPSHFSKHRRNTTATPQEYIEVTRPLPFDSLNPSCTLHILSHTFADTVNLPPITANYSPPSNCTWSRAVLHLSGTSNGSQYDRIAAVWLAGVELLRTSTPGPTDDGIFWNVRKDITKYSSILRQSNMSLAVMLENVVNDVYIGVYRLDFTFLYYDVVSNGTAIRKLKNNPVRSPNLKYSLELSENPADLIIPISASGDEGFWFRIESETDAVVKGIQIPLNTYRAVIEVYVSFHGNDEFWYSNPPDAYIEMNKMPTKRGHGSYREVVVKLDDITVGSVIPFPVIFTGGINPVFWEPVVSIGAFDLPSYEIELTPFLGMLLDGKAHYLRLGVADAISFWLVDANLQLWLDDKADKVQAQAVQYSSPTCSLERESKFEMLNGNFEIEGKRKSEFTGWVNSSAGNFTTYVSHELKFENTIEFSNNGTEKELNQKVKVTDKVKVTSNTGESILSNELERKYPLKITTSTLPGSEKDTYLMITKLENSIEEETSNLNFTSSLENSQKSEGWMVVKDHDVLSGAATSVQSYGVEDSFGCYNRRVSSANGYITNDKGDLLCARASS
ncbi:hypothetical protein BUALT_Bualt06G0059900 [Buddleja alternifolia]|uniref:Peptide N-acetyl-beta-D-glucosaminyl asparaginase amidase A N-terminal domain-containing protein n=1 Tax=Buddleja alternifolia TaxID=168488 RepID=A0AAV6XHJ7_9LAMI|nr:hypothetical protein BUALT_Bualt06G0059900 [Buddleja alternifolia]